MLLSWALSVWHKNQFLTCPPIVMSKNTIGLLGFDGWTFMLRFHSPLKTYTAMSNLQLKVIVNTACNAVHSIQKRFVHQVREPIEDNSTEYPVGQSTRSFNQSPFLSGSTAHGLTMGWIRARLKFIWFKSFDHVLVSKRLQRRGHPFNNAWLY